MAIHSPRLWWVAVALLLWTQHTHCRDITHEDIRDAMLSLIHMIRMTEDKLERHEYREKALGDQVKKMLSGLDKKYRVLEPVKGMISRLDERLSNVETILLQKEEREKTSQKKTNEALDNIQKSLQSLTATVTESLKPVKATEIDNNLTLNDDTLERRLDVTDAKIDDVKLEIKHLKNNLSKESIHAMCADVASDMKPFEKHISKADTLLNKYELKLNEYHVNNTKMQTDAYSLNDVSLADEAWHNKMAEVMERQEKDIKKIQQLLSDAESMWKDLPRLGDFRLATNQTLSAIVNATESIKENNDKSVGKVTTKIHEMRDSLIATNEDIQNSLTQSNTLTERAYNDISRSYETLRTEIQTLTKDEHTILQTADDVATIKKRLEYGVHRILSEVGEMIRIQDTKINKTISDRSDKIDTAIVESRNVSLKNMTKKIESEMALVWRQISMLHQQFTMNKGGIDFLTEQTKQYMNSSITTMRNVKQEVGTITTRVMELGDNLNFMLGQLALTTQEFSQISIGLNQALIDIKVSSNATEVSGPGPFKINSEDSTKSKIDAK